MVARNDITGDAIQTKDVSNAYRDNYDVIFRRHKKTDAEKFEEAILKNEYYEDDMQIRATENLEDFAACGCGRSPSGVCCGYHALTEEQWAQKQAELGGEDNK